MTKILNDRNMAFTPTDTIILIIVAVILIFGASKLPDIFRSLGRATGEFKKGKLEAEMELAQLQQQAQQQPQFQQPTSREKELENKLQELQKQLEELKKQQSQNQSK